MWLHEAQRSVLRCTREVMYGIHLSGVFATRSPDRRNPIGLHRTKVLNVEDRWVEVQSLEAIDGTPIVDIEPALDRNGDSTSH